MARAREAEILGARLAGDGGAGVEQAGDDGRVDIGNEALEHPAAVHHRHARPRRSHPSPRPSLPLSGPSGAPSISQRQYQPLNGLSPGFGAPTDGARVPDGRPDIPPSRRAGGEVSDLAPHEVAIGCSLPPRSARRPRSSAMSSTCSRLGRFAPLGMSLLLVFVSRIRPPQGRTTRPTADPGWLLPPRLSEPPPYRRSGQRAEWGLPSRRAARRMGFASSTSAKSRSSSVTTTQWRLSSSQVAYVCQQLFAGASACGCRPANQIGSGSEEHEYPSVTLGARREPRVHAPAMGTARVQCSRW